MSVIFVSPSVLHGVVAVALSPRSVPAVSVAAAWLVVAGVAVATRRRRSAGRHAGSVR